MHRFTRFTRFAAISLIALFATAAFASGSSTAARAGINVRGNVATTASTTGFGSSFSSMSITGVTSTRTANTPTGVDMKATNTWTGVGYSVKDGDATGTFNGFLDASAFANRVGSTEHCDPISLSAGASSSALMNFNGVAGQGGFTFVDSTGEVKGNVTRSNSGGVSTVTANVDTMSAKTTVISQTVTVDGVVLAAPTLQTASGAAAASFLLNTPVFSSHDED